MTVVAVPAAGVPSAGHTSQAPVATWLLAFPTHLCIQAALAHGVMVKAVQKDVERVFLAYGREVAEVAVGERAARISRSWAAGWWARHGGRHGLKCDLYKKLQWQL